MRICSTCTVKIDELDQVHYASKAIKDFSHLNSRVCQHVKGKKYCLMNEIVEQKGIKLPPPTDFMKGF